MELSVMWLGCQGAAEAFMSIVELLWVVTNSRRTQGVE